MIGTDSKVTVSLASCVRHKRVVAQRTLWGKRAFQIQGGDALLQRSGKDAITCKSLLQASRSFSPAGRLATRVARAQARLAFTNIRQHCFRYLYCGQESCLYSKSIYKLRGGICWLPSVSAGLAATPSSSARSKASPCNGRRMGSHQQQLLSLQRFALTVAISFTARAASSGVSRKC